MDRCNYILARSYRVRILLYYGKCPLCNVSKLLSFYYANRLIIYNICDEQYLHTHTRTVDELRCRATVLASGGVFDTLYQLTFPPPPLPAAFIDYSFLICKQTFRCAALLLALLFAAEVCQLAARTVP